MRLSLIDLLLGDAVISKSGVHAIRALSALAKLRDGEWAGAATVAEGIDAPRNYLGKLLQALSKAGLVKSQKGLGGGFRLARPPGSISLHDVVEPVDQLDRWSDCFLGMSQCSGKNPCVVHNEWGRIRAEYLGLLRKTTIEDLLWTCADPAIDCSATSRGESS